MTAPHPHHYDPNQPRIPAGDPSHYGGRWIGGGTSFGGNAPAFRNRTVGFAQAQMHTPIGREVMLPNGSRVPDAKSPTGYLMSPAADLRPVAEAGRRTGAIYRQFVLSPDLRIATLAPIFLAISFYSDVGTGGRFDYQRSGNQALGTFTPDRAYTQHREFRNVSNFNVGLYRQQAGLTLYETLSVAGEYASRFSSNPAPYEPYGLDPKTAEFIAVGFAAGQRGIFNQSP